MNLDDWSKRLLQAAIEAKRLEHFDDTNEILPHRVLTSEPVKERFSVLCEIPVHSPFSNRNCANERVGMLVHKGLDEIGGKHVPNSQSFPLWGPFSRSKVV